jgi:Tol biopolymer transport system component
VVLNLTDSSEVVIDSYLHYSREEFVICDFVSLSWCSARNVLLFAKSCAVNDSISQANLCMYDYDKKVFTEFPNITGAAIEFHPVMSSDGRHIAFLSSTKGVCILRLSAVGYSDRDGRVIYV